MTLDLRPDLDALDVVFDQSFVFDAHTHDRRTLITRLFARPMRASR